MQYIEYDPIPFASGISNIPNVHIYGVEAEATYISPDSRLHIDANLALEKGHVSGDYFSIDFDGRQSHSVRPYPSPCAFGGAVL